MQKDIKTQSIVLTILVIASLIVGYFVTVPFWKKLSTAQAELSRAQVEQESLQTAHSDMENFLGKFNSLSDKAEVAEKALPSDPQPAILLASVEQLANSAGLALSSVNVLESVRGNESTNAVISYDIQMAGSGSYFSVRDFLNRLELHLRIIDLQSFNLKVDESNTILFEMQLRTYYQKQ
jgi:Tfp pilus assembly protein PilO